MAPRKVRSVGDLLKGLPVDQAEAQLLLQRRRPAKAILKLLRSAVANAKNSNADANHLFVMSVRVDGGPMLKRFLPRARGSASPIEKKMSHVTIVLGVNEKLAGPKFKIVVPKKTKLPPSEDRRTKIKHSEKPEEEKKEPKKSQGFWKRTFGRASRKTGGGSGK